MKDKGRAVIFVLFQFFLACSLINLTVLCFLDGFGLSFSLRHILVFSFPFAALVFLFFCFMDYIDRGKRAFFGMGIFCLILFLLGVIIYIAVYFKHIKIGTNLIINEVKKAFTQYYGGVFYGNVKTKNAARDISQAAVLLVFFETFPVCYVIRKRGARWILFIASLGVVSVPFLAGLIMRDSFFLAYVICLFPAFAISRENRGGEQSRTLLRMLVLVVVLFCLLVGLRIFPNIWYTHNFDAEKTKKNIQEATYKLESDLFQKIFHSMEDSASYAGGLNKGELGWLDEIKYTNKSALEITIPEQIRNDKAYSLFFRSYVGERYESNQFKPMGREQRRDKEALDRKYGTDVGELNSQRIPLSGRTELDRKAKISIKNIWAGKDYFAPYACCDEVGFNREGNIEYANKPKDSDFYEVEYYYAANDILNVIMSEPAAINLNQSLGEASSKELSLADFSAIEKDYRDYVYKYDLRIPGNTCDWTVKAFQNLDKETAREYSNDWGYEIYKTSSALNLRQISNYIKIIKEYLSKKTKYSLSPGHLPENRDFTEYFLFGNKEGYCTYYAATATIAFRSLGIPARYVEGFKASKQDIDNARRNGDGTLTFILKDVNAHAWVEIYLDGYGWYPVEVTPGYEQNSNAEFSYSGHEQGGSDGSKHKEEESEDPMEEGEDEYDPYAFNSPKPELTEGEAEGAGFIGSMRIKKKLLPILAGLAVLLSCLIAVIAVRIQKHRRQQKLNNPVLAKRALYLYRVTEKRLKRSIKGSRAQTLLDIIKEMDGSIEAGSLPSHKVNQYYLTECLKPLKDKLCEIQRIGEKAYFSGRDISEEDWEKMRELCEAVMEEIRRGRIIL